jgi:hypothetical protein
VLFPCSIHIYIYILQPKCVYLYQSSSLLSSPHPMVAQPM